MSDPVDIEVGRLVARRRRIVGLSQAALAQRIGVSFQQVQKYETGQNRISASRLFKAAEVLGVGVAELFPVPHWTPEPDTTRDQLAEQTRLMGIILATAEQASKAAFGRAGKLSA